MFPFPPFVIELLVYVTHIVSFFLVWAISEIFFKAIILGDLKNMTYLKSMGVLIKPCFQMWCINDILLYISNVSYIIYPYIIVWIKSVPNSKENIRYLKILAGLRQHILHMVCLKSESILLPIHIIMTVQMTFDMIFTLRQMTFDMIFTLGSEHYSASTLQLSFHI